MEASLSGIPDQETAADNSIFLSTETGNQRVARIYVVDRNGEEHELAARPGQKVMEIIRDAGLPIEALCGGCCACSTCHVYVDPEWIAKLAPAQANELDTLGLAFDVRETSRLSCQIPFTEQLDGIRMTLGAE